MKQGNYAAIADAVRDNRETSTAERAGQHKHARALLDISTELLAIAKRAEAIPGTYRVWCHIYDSITRAEELAGLWNERTHKE